MSAFLCSAEHLSALIDYAVRRGNYGDGRKLLLSPEPRKSDEQHTFEVLFRENLKSLGYRYGKGMDKASEWFDGAVPLPLYRPGREFTAVEVIKLCDCYSYQSCEHDGWEASDAKKWIDGLRNHAWCNLPGYDKAAWAI